MLTPEAKRRGWTEAHMKKEWVGLTDEETKELIQKWAGELVFEVQAKLKEKNT